MPSLLGEPAGKINHSAFTGYQEFSSPCIPYSQGWKSHCITEKSKKPGNLFRLRDNSKKKNHSWISFHQSRADWDPAVLETFSSCLFVEAALEKAGDTYLLLVIGYHNQPVPAGEDEQRWRGGSSCTAWGDQHSSCTQDISVHLFLYHTSPKEPAKAC